MKTQKQAKQLFEKFLQRIPTSFGWKPITEIPESLRKETAKYCAIDCVDEILKELSISKEVSFIARIGIEDWSEIRKHLNEL